MRRAAALKGHLTSASGFTLLEALIAVAVLSLALGFVGSSLFQALGIQRTWREDVVAVKEARHAASWFAGDALNAEATDLVDGAQPVSSVTLTWTDREGVPHTALYSASGTSLVRDFDGSQIVLARRVVSSQFSLSGRVLTFHLEVEAAGGRTATVTLETYLRMLR